MTSQLRLNSIGVIHSPLQQAEGSPIQPRAAVGVTGTVDIFPEYAEGLKDLAGFERIWLVYWFDRSGPCRLTVQPFMDARTHGVFATRAPSRPNPIGISPVRLLRVSGNILHVDELDVLDGTALLDVKPYAPQFDSYPDARSGWLEGRSPDGKTADRRFGGTGPAKD